MSRPTFWVGDSIEIALGTTDTDTIDSLKSTNLGPNVHDNYTVIRWLIEWDLRSALVDAATSVGKYPTPWIAGVFFTPNYTGLGSEIDSGDLVHAEVGDAIYTERTKWTAMQFTDGTLYAREWHAHSPGVVDIHSKRTFFNHSSDRIWLGVQSLRDELSSSQIGFTVHGWVRIKCLVEI